MVVANQVIDTWSEGHLLAAWMVLWVVAFAALPTASSAYVLAVNANRPFKTVAEVVAAAKAKPGTLTYASAGIGGFGHTSGALFCVMTGVSMTHVPHKGAVGVLTSGRACTPFSVSSMM